MHFHCWELSEAAKGQNYPFIMNGQAGEGLSEHKGCEKCHGCKGNKYVTGIRRELAQYSPDLIQIPLCGKCNASIEAGDFCGVTMIVGKQYSVAYNMCPPCRESMVALISGAFKREKQLQPKKEGYKRNIII